MSYRLVGPWEFDADAVTDSGRAALSAVAQAVRDGDEAPLRPSLGRQAGLYLLMEGPDDGDPGQFRIAGFWVVMGKEWTAKGPAGPPDREPPVAKHLLDAATEEVWWENLPVASHKRGVWTPLVVLEWPPAMAWRSEVAPPGVQDTDGGAGADERDEPELWLATGEQGDRGGAEPEEGFSDEYAARFTHLPTDRAIVSVIRGYFKKTRALHTGTFQLLHPDAFGTGVDPLPFESWVETALQTTENPPVEEQPDDEHPHGRPLAMLGGHVAFPLAGWLTRTLGLWPPAFSEVRLGALTDREIQTRWIQQARMALSSTVAVLLLVIGFTVGIQTAAQPRPRPVPAEPPPAAQPAMSVCSAENQKFVEEFRCQIEHFAAVGDEAMETPACGDRGLDADEIEGPAENLQVEYCGLRDRAVDGWTASVGGVGTYSFAAIAGAQACFNVLGHPYPYQHPRSDARAMGDPAKFLDDEQLRIQPLVDLTYELDAACESYRTRLESRIEGAIFATHIGSRGGEDPASAEAGQLRSLALETALVGTSSDARTCFREGMDAGVGTQEYAGLCTSGTADKLDREIAESKIWQSLAGEPPAGPGSGLTDRYVVARFGTLDERSVTALPSLWQCHLQLDGQFRRGQRSVLGRWEIPMPMPSRYRTSGAGVRSQLQLDATMLALADGTGLDECWDVVRSRMASYQPAHPLLDPLEEAGWPSAEQQLCGQVCAAAYGVDGYDGITRWVTPRSDLIACVSGEPPRDPPDMGRNTLDRLRMPWNNAGRRGWVDPSIDHVCSFNLIAQGRLPAETSYIVNDFSPQQWAGETASGSRIAGGRDGLATQAVIGMSRFGTGSAWSVGSCGHVAAQCFTGVMMEVLGDGTFERYEWKATWKRRVTELARARPGQLGEEHPWCLPIQDYLSSEDMGAQFDAPCRKGVEDARSRAEYAIQTLATERDG